MNFARRIALALFAVLLITTWMHETRAEDLKWNDDFPRFRPAEYVVTGVTGVAAIAMFYGVTPRTEPRWTGGILFDDAARDALRLHDQSARDTVRKLSDYGAIASIVWVVGIDSIVVPLARKSTDTAMQMVLMDAEAFAVSSLVATSMFDGIARARPPYEECKNDPRFDDLCNSSPTTSFPSGHSAQAFTAAGLSCAHHLNLGLYGSPLADGLACAGALGLATATATFRVMGDRHYVSDVLAGALIGFGIGFGMPTLLHYSSRGKDASAGAVILPVADPGHLALVASFTL